MPDRAVLCFSVSHTTTTFCLFRCRRSVFLVCGFELDLGLYLRMRDFGGIMISKHFTPNHAMNDLSSTEQGGIVAVLGITALGNTTETFYRRERSPVEVISYVEVDYARKANDPRSVFSGRSRRAGAWVWFFSINKTRRSGACV